MPAVARAGRATYNVVPTLCLKCGQNSTQPPLSPPLAARFMLSRLVHSPMLTRSPPLTLRRSSTTPLVHHGGSRYQLAPYKTHPGRSNHHLQLRAQAQPVSSSHLKQTPAGGSTLFSG
jgi:hypothetical protein